MTVLKMADLVERLSRDKRKLESDKKEQLQMDAARKPVLDRVHMAIQRFGAYVHRNQLNEVKRPGDRISGTLCVVGRLLTSH